MNEVLHRTWLAFVMLVYLGVAAVGLAFLWQLMVLLFGILHLLGVAVGVGIKWCVTVWQTNRRQAIGVAMLIAIVAVVIWTCLESL
ncbi:MAG TPA: hypothetical protein VK673_01695 [Chthoniobacterales bacterium]|nr:hypothetical protein [Chthoniobacterales bacterium]